MLNLVGPRNLLLKRYIKNSFILHSCRQVLIENFHLSLLKVMSPSSCEEAIYLPEEAKTPEPELDLYALKADLFINKDDKCNAIYQCSICESTFHHQSLLKKHKQMHKESLSPGKTDESTGEIVIDEVELILEEDPNAKKSKSAIICDMCPSVFSSQSKLNDHILKHTGERPYKCPLCDKSYPVKGNHSISYSAF